MNEESEWASTRHIFFSPPDSIDWESHSSVLKQKKQKIKTKTRKVYEESGRRRKRSELNEKTLKTSCELIENTWKNIHKSRIVTNSFSSISNANFIQSQCFSMNRHSDSSSLCVSLSHILFQALCGAVLFVLQGKRRERDTTFDGRKESIHAVAIQEKEEEQATSWNFSHFQFNLLSIFVYRCTHSMFAFRNWKST